MFFFSNSQGPAGSVGPAGAVGPRGPSVCTRGRFLYKSAFREDESRLSIKKIIHRLDFLFKKKKISPC